MRLRALPSALFLLLAVAAGAAGAAESASTAAAEALPEVASAPLRVAVREVPPFATRGDDGEWQGLAIDLWRLVATDAGLRFELREASLTETLAGLEDGSLDVGLPAISVTPERVRTIDFTHPYLVTGITLAWRQDAGSAWAATLASLFSPEFLTALGTLLLVLFVSGALVWLAERRANPEQFGHGSLLQGLGTGFWWSAVTMTTVGYGDKAPITLAGRFVALVWMFMSLVIVASLTAAIAASLTTNSLRASLLRDVPLAEIEVLGVVQASASERFARDRGALPRTFPDATSALAALSAGDVEAVLHDRPILRYQARTVFTDLEVDPGVLARDDYAFALPQGSALRDELNAALLLELRSRDWETARARWLGATGAE